jgi:hypothetical protein
MSTDTDEETKAIVVKRIDPWPTVAVGIVCIALGYFAGREHVKYEIKSSISAALTTAQEKMSESFKNGFGAPTKQQDSGEPKTPPPTPQQLEQENAKKRELVVAEIKQLEESKSQAEAMKRELAKFRIMRSTFSKVKGPISEDPRISLTVKNETGKPILRASFLGTLISPGRAVPWLKDTFSYQIRGGLEPGEAATWDLAPNMFSEWGKVEYRNDMVLTVEVVKLEGPDGSDLFPVSFQERDLKRLESLRSSLNK